MDENLVTQFGKESEIRAEFNKRCEQEYDSNFSYRFLYKLRNYAQHHGFPINHISLGQRLLDNDWNKKEFYLRLRISKEEILKGFNWKRLTAEIRDLPEYIEILPHTISMMESLKRIHIHTINALFGTLTENAKLILEYANRVSQFKGHPAIFELETDNNDIRTIKTIPHIFIPVSLAQKIIDGDITKIFSY